MNAQSRLDELARQAAVATRDRAAELARHRPSPVELTRTSRRRRTLRVALAATTAIVVVLVAVSVWPHSVPTPDVAERPGDGSTARPDPGRGWERVDPGTSTEGADIMGALAQVSGRLVAVGIDADNSAESGLVRPGVWASDDGSTWRRIPADAIDDGGATFADAGLLMHDVAALEGDGQVRLVAVGTANFEPDERATAWVSEDLGETWSMVPIPVGPDHGSSRLTHVALTSEGLAAVGGHATAGAADSDGGAGLRPAAWTSADGLTWGPPEVLDEAPGVVAADVTSRDGRTVVVGGSNTSVWRGVAWTRTDGGGWTSTEVVDEAVLDSVTATPDGFVAVGWTRDVGTGGQDARAIVWTSPDGITWAAADDEGLNGPGHQRAFDVAAGRDGTLVVVGHDGALGSGAVWIRHAGGGSWQRIGAADLSTRAGDGAIVEAVTPFREGVVAVGSVDGATGPDAAVWFHRGPIGVND